MAFALTTRWNASRHSTGESMLEEILEMGIYHVELGYDLRMDLVPGVQKMAKDSAVRIDSVHNFCPLPVGAFNPHPEIYTLADVDAEIRERAIHHTRRSIQFAAEVGATTVVTHAGNVSMKPLTRNLISLHQEGKQFTKNYEKTKLKMQVKRDKRASKQLRFLYASLEQLLPTLEEHNVSLAIENLPTWEALPTEIEAEQLLRHFRSPHIRYWHDLGHGQIRENLGLINHTRWLQRLSQHLAGMHIHDVFPPACDHVMPPQGHIHFDQFREFLNMDILKVIEPTPKTPKEEVLQALEFLKGVA